MTDDMAAAQGTTTRARERSPNYPAIPLSDAIPLAQQIYDKEKRTAVPAEVAAKALGYSSLGGGARTALASLRQFGLIEVDGGSVRVSQLALDIIHHPEESPERSSALAAAAMRPPLIAEIAKSHSEASDDALRAHLITRRKFSPEGAGRFVHTFRDALQFADPGEQSSATDDMPPRNDSRSAQASAAPPPPGQTNVTVLFSGMLAKGISAEVRVTGDVVRSEHIERLRKHLELAKDALDDVSDDEI